MVDFLTIILLSRRVKPQERFDSRARKTSALFDRPVRKRNVPVLLKYRCILVHIWKELRYMQPKCLHRNRCGCHSPAINFSLQRDGCHLLDKWFACSNRLIATNEVRLREQIPLFAYLHKRIKRILKADRALLTTYKTEILRQLPTGHCSHGGTSTGSLYQHSCFTNVEH